MNARPVLQDIVSQHAEQAAFLWSVRHRAVHQPNHWLRQLRRLDERIDGHLDGLLVAGDVGMRVCREQAESGEAGEAFVLAVAALGCSSLTVFQEAIDAVRPIAGAVGAVAGALAWIGGARAVPYLNELLRSADTKSAEIAIAAAANLRIASSELVQAACSSRMRPVRLRGLRALGQMRCTDLAYYSPPPDRDGESRFWAAHAGALLGDTQAVSELCSIAEDGGPHAEAAADLACRAMRLPEATAWHQRLASTPRLAAKCAVALGVPDLMEWVLALAEDEAQARVAGEAFSALTGLRLDWEDLEAVQPSLPPAQPSDDPDDENVELDPDENLPVPDPTRMAMWWRANSRKFPPGQRYVLGIPLYAADALTNALRNGSQPQRAGAALDLALRVPGSPVFEIRARANLQVLALSNS